MAEVPDRPIDSHLPDAHQLVEIQVNQTRVINNCLHNNGVREKVTNDPTALADFTEALVRDRRSRTPHYGFFDSENAGRYGYTAPKETQRSFGPTVPAQIPIALFNTCWQSAEKSAKGMSVVMEESALPNGGPPSAADSPIVKSIWKEWSGCMQGHGFSYRSPIDALRDRRWGGESSASQLETRVAKADIQCKQKMNLVGIAVNVQARLDQDYIKKNAEALRSLTYQWPSVP